MVQVISVFFAFPFALMTGFGRSESAFQLFSHTFALIPGILGDYLRVAYYHLTLDHCSLNSRISFGSFFAQSSSTVNESVYIGAYCVLGACNIGERSQIASHVQILAGRRQHPRAADGRIMGTDKSSLTPIAIGKDCWIGASAVVMADIGARTTIGAGAVVTKPMPSGVVSAGNPARVLKPASTTRPIQNLANEKEELVC
ncbi:MAG: DapH/DapD/GlmU-related protein [Candidatus Acidiferrales bacterium]